MQPTSKNEIQFKPLNEGLGFHPFSEGLPYSPSSRVRTQEKPLSPSGTGALAAGHPSFTRAMPSIAPGVKPREETHELAAPVISEALQSPIEDKTEELLATNGMSFVFRRIASYLLDTAVNFALCSAALGWALWKQNISPNLFLNPQTGFALLVFILFFSWALTTAQEIAFGASGGKRLLGLSLPGSAPMLLLRSLLFLTGTIFCGFGLLWALFNRDRLCWHDVATGVHPVNSD